MVQRLALSQIACRVACQAQRVVARWMRFAMRIKQLFQTDLSVDLSGVEFGVAEDGLNGANVCSGVVHQRGHSVTKDMTRTGLFNVGTLDVATSVLSTRIGMDGSAEQREEERSFFGIESQLIAGLFDVASDP